MASIPSQWSYDAIGPGISYLLFWDGALADRVLHAYPPEGATIRLIFHRWRKQTGELFSPLCYKVLLSITNIYAPIWSKDVVQEILGSLCKVFKTAPTSATGEHLSSFMVVVWTMHPDLIPTEVGCMVPEPEGPSEVGQRPLFLRVGELILSNYIVMTY
jgi:hypothetical protein